MRFGHQAADMVAIASVRHEEDGGMSVSMATSDGETGEALSSRVLFRVWISFADFLAHSLDLGKEERELCAKIVAMVRGEDGGPAVEGARVTKPKGSHLRIIN
jgi:hypothetical protein